MKRTLVNMPCGLIDKINTVNKLKSKMSGVKYVYLNFIPLVYYKHMVMVG